jgi:hypothetical protein
LKSRFGPPKGLETFGSTLENESPKMNIIPMIEIDKRRNMNCSIILSFKILNLNTSAD